jgi:lipid-binding SYLF domain-containing protein
MNIGRKTAPKLFAAGILTATSIIANFSFAGAAREEGRLLTATEVLQDVQSMPDQRLPDTLLAHAYGIAVIPDVTKIAFFFGGRHGNGVLTVRNTLSSPWSNPVFIALTGGSWGLQAGAQSSDIILVFTTKGGIEGITGGKLTLGADASVAAGPVGRQGSAATDVSLAEIYSYARTRGLFGGIAVDGSVIAIDKSANADFYGKKGVTASEIFAGNAPTPPETAERFLTKLAQVTHTVARSSPAPQAEAPAATAQTPAPPSTPAAEAPRTYPLDNQNKN